ncbi:MAG TPA: glycosyltransferase [Kofleriaceae bacterium]|nr:glycosyltransferase [Kofleriaceae bacterium]
MRIGVVTTSYPRFAGDLAGSFVAAHVAALRELGHEVEVIAAGEPCGDPRVTRIASPLFYAGGAPEALERGARGALGFTVRHALAVARRARRWDRVVAHWLAPSAIAALAGRAPLTAIAHGGDVHLLRRTRLLAPVLHALRARGARLAFVSDELRAIARAAAPELAGWLGGALVQPMGVPLAHFAALGRAAREPPVILFVGRLVPVKGTDVAIRALGALAGAARLVIAGEGPERGALEQLAAGAPVEFVGAVDPAARDRLLREAAVVVVPSRVLANGRSEGTPTIALEALAAGVPIVASAVGGLRALAPAAELAPPDDPRALAAALDRALVAPRAAEELQRAVAGLDWPEVARRLLG